MASSKDVFEANVFEANVFAAGVFRGVGADLSVPKVDIRFQLNSPRELKFDLDSPKTLSFELEVVS